MRERNSRRVLFKYLESISSEQVEELLLKHLLPGCTVFIDEFKSYYIVDSLGYGHFSVNHSDSVYALDLIHVSGGESFNRYLKTFLRIGIGNPFTLLVLQLLLELILRNV